MNSIHDKSRTEGKESYDGKLIRAVHIGWGRDAVVIEVPRDHEYEQELVLHNEYHGEYDIDWIVLLERGKEISRYAVNKDMRIYWL